MNTHHFVLKAANHTIDKVTKLRLLGIIIDDHLTWTANIDSDPVYWVRDIDYLCSTLSAKISLLRQLSTYVPQEIQKLYYQSYILSVLDYGCNTWGTTYSANIERLSKLQKRATCIILKADFLTPSNLMFETLRWLSVPKSIFEPRHVISNNLTF